MSRESKIKAVAGALQAKSLDLTQFARARSATREREATKMRTDNAAGALAFQAADVLQDGEVLVGDELAPLLLRLKYAGQWTRALMILAVDILLKRHAGLATKHGHTMRAVAMVAVFEWAHDRCSKCRPQRAVDLQPEPCRACAPPTAERSDGNAVGRRDEFDFVNAAGQSVTRMVTRTMPLTGCPKCRGLGRIFPVSRRAQSFLRCVTCRNTGREEFKRKRRFLLVNELMMADGYDGLKLDTFRAHWLPQYEKFLGVLRVTDREIASGLDFGLRASENRATPPQQEED